MISYYDTNDTMPFVDSVNEIGDTPLSLACTNGHFDTVKYLVVKCHYSDLNSKLSCMAALVSTVQEELVMAVNLTIA